MTNEILRTPLSRVFMIEDGAGPGSTPEYLGFARATTAARNLGDVTLVRQPAVDQSARFTVIDRIKGQPDPPTITIHDRSRRATLTPPDTASDAAADDSFGSSVTVPPS